MGLMQGGLILCGFDDGGTMSMGSSVPTVIISFTCRPVVLGPAVDIIPGLPVHNLTFYMLKSLHHVQHGMIFPEVST